MHRGLRLFVILGAGFWGVSCIAAAFAVADGANPGGAAPSTGGSPGSGQPVDTEAGSWRLVRSATAAAGTGALAIQHTADLERSDPRLAGFMLRCGKEGIEAVVVVVEPFPPHARPQITLRAAGQESNFSGTIIPPGAGIRLPGEAARLVTGSWHMARELEIKVSGDGAAFAGIITLSGFAEALESLNAECVQK